MKALQFTFAFLITAFACLCVSVSAQAQGEESAAVDYSTSYDSFSTYIARAQETYNVFVFGDSLAEGLAAGFKRQVRGNDRYQVLPRGRSGTGLARPDRYDWSDAVERILDRQRVDIAIIFIGSNDTGSISTDEGRFDFGSEAWHTAYSAYTDRLIETLRANGTAVYWVELPPMARDDYDEKIQEVSTLQRERTLAAGVRYVSIREHFLDENGEYTMHGTDLEGEVRRLRSRDGVHFIRRGNNKVASFVLTMIERDVEDVESGGLSAFEDVVGGTATEVRTATPGIPIFGQESETGASLRIDLGPEITLVEREDQSGVTGLNVTLRTQDSSSGNALVVPGGEGEAYAPRVAPNSLAARVLIDGQSVEARNGRADDFSWPRAN